MPRPTKFDIFLSYSSDDREAVILPLLKMAEERHLNTWCDLHEITWGDSILDKIHEGLNQAAFVIAFISHSYLKKPWPLKELKVALAKQLAGGPSVLPVLLGVSPDELNEQLPFLADIKHIGFYQYKPSEPVSDWSLTKLFTDLERKRAPLSALTFAQGEQIATLTAPAGAVSSSTNYNYFSILSVKEAVESYAHVHGGGRQVIAVEPLFAQFLLDHAIADTPAISCVWADATWNPHLYFALRSGNLLVPHRASLFNPPEPELRREAYTSTGAPPNPACITVAGPEEVFFGYEDGSIFALGRPCGQHYHDYRSAITRLDASLESILVAGHADGTITIRSRKNLRMLQAVSSGGVVRSLAVCCGGAAIFATGHDRGRIRLWSYQGEALMSLQASGDAVRALAFSPGGYEYLVAAVDQSIYVWNYHTGENISSFVASTSPLVALHIGFSRGFRLVMKVTAGLLNGTVMFWPVSIAE